MIPRLAVLVLPLLLAASAATTETPLRSYNAGVALLENGAVDEAIALFEQAAVGSGGALHAAALHNLALALARSGDAIRETTPEEESRENRIERLTRAATSYRRSLAFFTRVPPPAPDADVGARAAKVRLLASLDEVHRLTEEARKEAEDEALKAPAALILTLMTSERDRRRAAVRLAALDRRRRRRPIRGLRKDESGARRLTEKLAIVLEDPPGAAPDSHAAPPIPKEIGARAAGHVREAARAMGEAEGRLEGLDATAARGEQTRAIGRLRAAGMVLVAPLPTLVGKLIGDQSGLLDATRAGGPWLVPEEQGEIGAWVEAFTTLPDPPDPPEPRPPAPLTKEITAKIRALAVEALASSRRAAESLDAGRTAEAVPEQEVVLAKLAAIRDLLPKPPKSPAERIRELIAKEREVRSGIDGLPGLNEEARRAGEENLGTRQRDHGREAGAIAKDLGDSPGEKEKAAAEKVREAEGEILAAGESLGRARDEPAGEATDRAVERLEEALAILSGEDGKQKGDPDRKKDGGDESEDEKQRSDPRRLDAAEARRMMEEMDRDRRDEEKKLFPGGGGMKVDKDW